MIIVTRLEKDNEGITRNIKYHIKDSFIPTIYKYMYARRLIVPTSDISMIIPECEYTRIKNIPKPEPTIDFDLRRLVRNFYITEKGIPKTVWSTEFITIHSSCILVSADSIMITGVYADSRLV